MPLRQGDYKTLLWPEMVREELTVAQGDGFPRAWGGGGKAGGGPLCCKSCDASGSLRKAPLPQGPGGETGGRNSQGA